MAKKQKEENKTEREYVIPLREKVRVVPRYKKTNKAIKSIKEFIAKHMKIYDRDLNKIKVDKYVNEFIWARGIRNPPHKVKVRAIKDSSGIVGVELVDYPNKLKFKKLRAEKLGKDAKERIESKKTMMQKAKETMQARKEGKTEEKESSEEKDKNKDGIDDKKEAEIKEKTSKEAEEKIEKDLAKKQKHTTKAKSGKEKLAEKKEYDQRSQHK